jgi:hypothetical protein
VSGVSSGIRSRTGDLAPLPRSSGLTSDRQSRLSARAFRVVSTVILWLTTIAASVLAEFPDSATGVCQKAFFDVRPGGSARTPGVIAPNKRYRAWSEGAWLRTPDLFQTAIIVYDKTADRVETIFRTRADKAGHVVGPAGQVLAHANADEFCVVDWSRDSRYLFVSELIGPTESDNTTIHLWIYDLQRKRRFLVQQAPLRRAIENYWTRKGANFRDVSYVLSPEGWQDSGVPRPAFTATVLEGSPTAFPQGFDGFLGAWSVGLSGDAPRLLTENRAANVMKRYGAVESKQP